MTKARIGRPSWGMHVSRERLKDIYSVGGHNRDGYLPRHVRRELFDISWGVWS